MESLECPNALAKQVLSQLSYTPSRPQGSLQNPPYGVTSEAAIGRFRDLDVVLCRPLFGQV
jgi:hypothetical protein